MPLRPYLLYAYLWMPFPRRIIIYLREKQIPSSLVTVVPVSDPQLGNAAPPGYPPRPQGSLPILCIPSVDHTGAETYIHIRQSIAIMTYLDELCDEGRDGFPLSRYPMRGRGALGRARESELLSLADQCTSDWNPVRTFGSGAGTMSIPAASKEMLRWIHRTLRTIEDWWHDKDFAHLQPGSSTGPTMAEIVLYQFLEFTHDCYGKDMTKGSGEKVKDVYDREVTDEYKKIPEFYEAFRARASAKRDEAAGEVPGEQALEKMMTWAEGSS